MMTASAAAAATTLTVCCGDGNAKAYFEKNSGRSWLQPKLLPDIDG